MMVLHMGRPDVYCSSFMNQHTYFKEDMRILKCISKYFSQFQYSHLTYCSNSLTTKIVYIKKVALSSISVPKYQVSRKDILRFTRVQYDGYKLSGPQQILILNFNDL
jgi:hypothetical protein